VRLRAIDVLGATLAAAFVVPLALAGAPPGTRDDGFGEDGIVVTDLGPGIDEPAAAVLQPDGKIVVAGRSGPHSAVARYTQDGRLDRRFGSGGIVRLSLTRRFDRPFGIALDRRGGILVGIKSDDANGDRAVNDGLLAVVRLTPSGERDGAFGRGGVARRVLRHPSSFHAAGLGVDARGRITALARRGGRGHRDFVARWSATGVPLGLRGYRVASAALFDDAAVAPDGTVVAAGMTSAARHFALLQIRPGARTARLSTTSFGSEPEHAAAVALQRDGRIVTAGMTSYSGRAAPGWCRGHCERVALARHLADGRLDPSFGDGGRVVLPAEVFDTDSIDVAIAPNGRIVVGFTRPASGRDTDLGAARLHRDGRIDRTFGNGGFTAVDVESASRWDTDQTRAVVVRPDGSVVLVGAVEPDDRDLGNAIAWRFALVQLRG
jgi:uncharacterized delta-60 repeat protein